MGEEVERLGAAQEPGLPQLLNVAQSLEGIRLTFFLLLVLFGTNVLTRGEVARALEVLARVHRNLLWMARLLEHATEHWPTPARAAEQDLSAAIYARYVACSATAQKDALWMAYRASWVWGKEMMQTLAQRHNISVPDALLAQMDRRLLEQP